MILDFLDNLRLLRRLGNKIRWTALWLLIFRVDSPDGRKRIGRFDEPQVDEPQVGKRMIVAENPRFVFVHVFKTGGTSIKRALRRHAMKPGQEFANFFLKRMGVPQFGPVYYPDHLTASKLIERFGKTRFESYYSFGFVRNPWDWEVSLYKYILKNRKHRDHAEVGSLGNFGEYIRWRCDGRFRLQQEFLYQHGKPVVDFIGRFENLSNDFRLVCQQLKIRHRLPKLNKSRISAYESYYTEDLKELVRLTYRSDIEEFGYDFGDSLAEAA